MSYNTPAKRTAAKKRYYERHPEKLVAKRRAYTVKKRYGLSRREYELLVDAQGGLCAICKTSPATDVDHDHGTGRVRGLLCSGCNVGMGRLGDDVSRVRACLEYLESRR